MPPIVDVSVTYEFPNTLMDLENIPVPYMATFTLIIISPVTPIPPETTNDPVVGGILVYIPIMDILPYTERFRLLDMLVPILIFPVL